MIRYLILVLPLLFVTSAYAETLSDKQIRERLIQQSQASYPGNCACPYNRMSNGRSCGGRSAYSKPGGYEPLSYKQDISDEMVKRYRESVE